MADGESMGRLPPVDTRHEKEKRGLSGRGRGRVGFKRNLGEEGKEWRRQREMRDEEEEIEESGDFGKKGNIFIFLYFFI